MLRFIEFQDHATTDPTNSTDLTFDKNSSAHRRQLRWVLAWRRAAIPIVLLSTMSFVPGCFRGLPGRPEWNSRCFQRHGWRNVSTVLHWTVRNERIRTCLQLFVLRITRGYRKIHGLFTTHLPSGFQCPYSERAPLDGHIGAREYLSVSVKCISNGRIGCSRTNCQKTIIAIIFF